MYINMFFHKSFKAQENGTNIIRKPKNHTIKDKSKQTFNIKHKNNIYNNREGWK